MRALTVISEVRPSASMASRAMPSTHLMAGDRETGRQRGSDGSGARDADTPSSVSIGRRGHAVSIS